VHGLTFADIPARVVERQGTCCSMVFGAALVGAQLPCPPRHLGCARAGGSGDSVIIGTGRTAAAPPAVLAQQHVRAGLRARRLPPLAPLHSGSLIIPALLAGARRGSAGSGAIVGRRMRSPRPLSVSRWSAGRAGAARCADAVSRLATPARCSARIRGHDDRQAATSGPRPN